MGQDKILASCSESFARAWEQADQMLPLFSGHINAMALVVRDGDVLHVRYPGPGFAELFGSDGMQDWPNFLLRADRRDRQSLLRVCDKARDCGGTGALDVTWAAGSGCHAGDSGNFFETVVSVECVGQADGCDVLYLAFKDIDARRKSEHRLARSRFSTALRALFDEIFLLDLETGESEPVYAGGRPLVDEDGAPIASGFHALHATVHPDDITIFWKFSNYTYLESELYGENPPDAVTFDLRRQADDGVYHWARIYIARIETVDKRKQVLVCSQNIDEQKDAQRRERELRSRAQTDGLTGIYNHGTSEALMRAVLDGLGDGDEAVFSIIDVDDFKRVNDGYGHSTGDKLLQAVAEALSSTCRGDDIVGRMGGDEFVVLFVGGAPDEEQLRQRFETCKARVREASAELGIDPPVTLSTGSVEARGPNASYNEVFDRADRLLYDVKRSGKNSLRFE